MEYKAFHAFENCLSEKEVFKISDYSEFVSFRELLRKCYFDFIGEIRNNDISAQSKTAFLLYVNDFQEKLNRISEDLFIKDNDIIFYRSKESILVVPIQKNEPMSLAANAQYEYINSTIDHLISKIQKNEPNKFQNSELNNWLLATKPKKEKEPRPPTRQSFELKHPNVNLNAVHRILAIDNKFIGDTTCDNFKSVFSGESVTNKVIWYNANSLRYFIRAIVDKKSLKKEEPGERGVKHPHEGIWQRTITCFKKPVGDYKVKDFKDTHDPVARITRLLGPAIDLINHPKK